MTVHEFTGGAPQSSAVVIGRAQNVSNVTIRFAMIAVNFYDKNGKFIAKASAIKENLGPGEVWDFGVKTVGPDAWKIISYDIAASTRQ
jgi:predicted lipid-binding transport protein (Tim44 family)